MLWPRLPGAGLFTKSHVLFVNPANEAMGVNVVQIFVGGKYCRVTGTDQLPISVVKVVANVLNEIRCVGAVGGFNCVHCRCFLVPGTPGSVGLVPQPGYKDRYYFLITKKKLIIFQKFFFGH